MSLFRILFLPVSFIALFHVSPIFAEESYFISKSQVVSDLDTFQECEACPSMVVLPKGYFSFGSTEKEAREAHRRFKIGLNIDPDEVPDPYDTFVSETPKHDVTIDVPIAMGLTEVTREEWAACVAERRCADEADARIRFRLRNGPYQDHPRSPITAVTYTEMQDYLAWLNDKVGAKVYRLPTEVEWEYAARAGAKTIFAQGDSLTREQANFSIYWREIEGGRSVWKRDPGNEKRPVTVDELDAANSWGLRHMSGNVSETTRSCWSEGHLGFASSARYLAASYRPLGCRRVGKGGSYGASVELARPARRVGHPEDYWGPWVGFRIVRELKAEDNQEG
ncbi:formylglycine-generating enzyme family protein [Ruegeria atlantica]|uniref:formylglycine-generating enzyme family protein n=1 Tax=Ruegeria atlantica TaxID=81569 RepID=UPI00147A1887|nr:formylglycine-generating enzyme family protein [Ruegeria atlantica]